MTVCCQCGGDGFVAESCYDELTMANAHSCYHCGESGHCSCPADQTPVDIRDNGCYKGFDCGPCDLDYYGD